MALRSLTRTGTAFLAYAAARRLSRRSGVTDAEYYGSLPGDGVVPHPMIEWTRGTTISAQPGEIWPWLVQMGYGRGGWYTSERFDRLVWRIDNPTADTILPEWQHLNAGDIVPDGPDYAAYFRVVEVREREAIVYHSIRYPGRGQAVDPTDPEALRRREEQLQHGGVYIDFSWVFALRPVDGNATRLLIRTRANIYPRRMRFTELPFGLVDLFHVSTMFRGIRQRAEARR